MTPKLSMRIADRAATWAAEPAAFPAAWTPGTTPSVSAAVNDSAKSRERNWDIGRPLFLGCLFFDVGGRAPDGNSTTPKIRLKLSYLHAQPQQVAEAQS